MGLGSINWPCYLHDCISPLWKSDELCVEFWKEFSGSNENLTFAQFSEFSDELAGVLQVLIKNRYTAIGRKCVVAIVWIPHILTSVIVQGILKAGAIFYPVLPHSCHETLKYFDAHLIAVICLNDTKDVLEGLTNFEPYSSDVVLNPHSLFQRCDWTLFLRSSSDFSSPDGFSQNLLTPNTLPAYVITTSGSFSDGKKVICVAHSCITANIIDLINRFGSCDSNLKPTRSVLLASPLTFDPSIVQIYFSLISHRRLIIPNSTIFIGPTNLASLCLNAQVDWVQCTPSQFAMIDLKSRLKILSNPNIHLILGGEPFPLTLFSNLRRIKASIHGIYGTTEVSSWATFYSFNSDIRLKDVPECHCPPPIDGSTPIGYPMFATHTKLLSTNSETVFELCVSRELGGFSIIRPRSSSIADDDFEKAIQLLPFSQMWETGDLVQVGACNKCLWFIGRKDRIVKRFGYQICLERLEHTICSFKIPQLQIQRCRCQISRHNGKQQLVLFAEVKQFQSDRRKRPLLSITSWRKKFQLAVLKRLKKIFYPNSDPWLPSSFVISSHLLPVSAHGKLIYKPLHLRTQSSHIKSEILRLWNNAIGKTSNLALDSGSSFFELGGNSLAALIFVETLILRFPKLRLARSKVLTNIFTKTFSQFVKITLQYLERNKNIEHSKLGFHKQPIETTSNIAAFKNYDLIDLEQGSSSYVSTRGQCAYWGNLFSRHLSMTHEWQLDLGKCVDASPIIVSDINSHSHSVFIGSHSGLFTSLTLSTGQSTWSQSGLDLSGRIEAPACAAATYLYSNPLIAVGTLNGRLYTIEAERGIILNCYNTTGALKSAPLFVSEQDLIIIGSHSRFVHAYDLRTPSSQSVWSYNLDDSAIVAPISGFQTKCKTFKSILVASLGGSLGCLDLRNPTKPLWVNHDQIPIFCKPVSFLSHCFDSLAFRVSVDGTVLALSTLTGNVVWKTKPLSTIGNYSVFSDPILRSDDRILIVTTNNGFIYALNIFNGQVPWILDCRFGLKPGDPSSLNTPYIIDTSSNLSLLAITRADGMIIVCQLPKNSPVLQQPDVMCTYNLPNKCFSSPVLCSTSENDNLHLVCGCRDDQVHCFSISAMR